MSVQIEFRIIVDEEQTKNGIKGIIALWWGNFNWGRARVNASHARSYAISITSFSTCTDDGEKNEMVAKNEKDYHQKKDSASSVWAWLFPMMYMANGVAANAKPVTSPGCLSAPEEDDSLSAHDMAEAIPLPVKSSPPSPNTALEIFSSSPKVQGPFRDDLFLWRL